MHITSIHQIMSRGSEAARQSRRPAGSAPSWPRPWTWFPGARTGRGWASNPDVLPDLWQISGIFHCFSPKHVRNARRKTRWWGMAFEGWCRSIFLGQTSCNWVVVFQLIKNRCGIWLQHDWTQNWTGCLDSVHSSSLTCPSACMERCGFNSYCTRGQTYATFSPTSQLHCCARMRPIGR